MLARCDVEALDVIVHIMTSQAMSAACFCCKEVAGGEPFDYQKDSCLCPSLLRKSLILCLTRLKDSRGTRDGRQAGPEFRANAAPPSRRSIQTCSSHGMVWRGLTGKWRDCGAVRRMPRRLGPGAPDSRPDAPSNRRERKGRDVDRGTTDLHGLAIAIRDC